MKQAKKDLACFTTVSKKKRVISRILYPASGAMVISLWMLVARHLLQPTRRQWAGSPWTSPYLVLLRMGFAVPWMSPFRRWALASPFHPYPGVSRAVCFLWHFPPVTRRSRYEPFCPAEFGLSSPANRPERPCARFLQYHSAEEEKLKGESPSAGNSGDTIPN